MGWVGTILPDIVYIVCNKYEYACYDIRKKRLPIIHNWIRFCRWISHVVGNVLELKILAFSPRNFNGFPTVKYNVNRSICRYTTTTICDTLLYVHINYYKRTGVFCVLNKRFVECDATGCTLRARWSKVILRNQWQTMSSNAPADPWNSLGRRAQHLQSAYTSQLSITCYSPPPDELHDQIPFSVNHCHTDPYCRHL